MDMIFANHATTWNSFTQRVQPATAKCLCRYAKNAQPNWVKTNAPTYERKSHEAKNMSDLLDRMAQLRAERVARLAALHENTIAMRRVADEAQRAGNTPYRIAQLLGVTNRTVYLWLKK